MLGKSERIIYTLSLDRDPFMDRIALIISNRIFANRCTENKYIVWIIQKKNLKEEIHLKVKLKEKYTPQVVPGWIVIKSSRIFMKLVTSYHERDTK